ncbi:MAG TPA: ATP-binding protein [Nitrosospira sp.]|nr:ATP-binding protein [Nitrosospira sp.]
MNIKSVTKFSNVALALLLVIMGPLFFHELTIREEINTGERRRYQALMLADELLQSSDDLTRMSRTYVITGDPIYKHYFMEIYDIRRGIRPRPLNYTPAYWHLVAAGRAPAFEPGEAVPMLEMLRRAGFSEEEYALMRKALENSEALAELEKQAFAAVEGFREDGTGSFTVRAKPDRARAIQLLFGKGYTAHKADIMEPIQQVMDLYNVRMQNELNRKLARLERQSLIEMVLIFAALLATMGILFYTRLGILQPLTELGRQVAGLTRGAYPSRYGKAATNEVAKLSEALTLADAEKQQLLENERIARTEAERASQLKDEFLATLSHELRTPLNAILGWSQLILSGTMKKEDIHKGLETIERNARAQNKLIEDLLEMSSIISGKVRLDMQSLDAASLVDATVESVVPTAQAKGIVLTKNIDSQASPISGDPNRLQQIFWNLLSNSIKFTPRGGKVAVTVEQLGSLLEIRIDDSGLGISPEFMPFVFDRFRQGDASLTRQYGGLGLGLAIVKQLVELHGGTVRAESAGTGEGSSFIVNLPLATAEGGLENSFYGQNSFPRRVPSFGGRKVLVIDDELDARELIKRILVRCNTGVITAANAEEGLEILKMERPDLIISDIGMPGKNGYQFMLEVRKLSMEDGGQTPAIALTAFARPDDARKALDAGYQKHLSKPVDAHALINIITDLIGRQRETGE